jgi:lipopolysaccharide/colanic/teichoic acid biosynthesis glycosyltransferase
MSGQIRSRLTPVLAPRDAREHATLNVLPERMFHDALLREVRRARRFEEAFVLSRITLTGRGNLDGRWARLVEALQANRREADIVGWFHQDKVLGIIRPVPGADGPDAAGGPFIAAHQELAAMLAPEVLNGCSLHVDAVSPTAGEPPLFGDNAPGRRPGGAFRRAAKRTLDIAASAALVTALAPVFLAVAAAVKLTSRGPVFFRQERIGRGGGTFTMLKFRTMRANNNPAIHQQYVTQFIQSGEPAAVSSSTADKPVFKLVNDPRVTPVGSFLRRSSLDELPQFWNVLRGDMSLVGPRPPLSYEVDCYRRWHWHRVLDAKPGITGLWQVTGRSRTSFDEMVRLDIRYARTHTLWTDVRILLATPRAVVSGNGAH